MILIFTKEFTVYDFMSKNSYQHHGEQALHRPGDIAPPHGRERRKDRAGHRGHCKAPLRDAGENARDERQRALRHGRGKPPAHKADAGGG